MSHFVAIVGPTATGKTRLAIDLAQSFSGEIINADSRQVYRHMNIGTAKPTPEERSLVPHYLIDIINPDEEFSLAHYKRLANQAISDIIGRDKLPFLVGGTGLYVWSVIGNWQIPEVPPDYKFRESLAKIAETQGASSLYQELSRIDPEAAEKINSGNIRRVIRALEVYKSTNVPFSHLQMKNPMPFKTIIIGLTQERARLYQRVDARVDDMVKSGLVKEVENLVKMGYDLSLPAMSAIGYRQIGLYLKRELKLEEAVKRIKFETHRYVRQQYSWFRLKDARINWFDVGEEPESRIKGLVSDFLSGKEVRTV